MFRINIHLSALNIVLSTCVLPSVSNLAVVEVIPEEEELNKPVYCTSGLNEKTELTCLVLVHSTIMHCRQNYMNIKTKSETKLKKNKPKKKEPSKVEVEDSVLALEK